MTLAGTSARRIFWPVLKELNTAYNLGGQPNETLLTLTMPNRSLISCAGAKDLAEIEKLRGRPFKRVYIDEAQSFRSDILETLIDDVVEPALLDYAGTLRVIGTPGAVKAGKFWDLCQSPEWAHHHWTFFDNPHIVRKAKMSHEALLARILKRRGVPITDPSIQREFFGLWVSDLGSLVLQFDDRLNGFTDLESGTWHCVLGVDLGFKDSDALAVLAWNDKSNDVYLVEEVVTAKQDITSLVGQIEQLRKRWDITKIVMDTGGLGLKIAEEIQRRFGIPLEAADKRRKMENLALLNDSLRRGQFKARPSGMFAHDTRVVEWDRDKSRPDRLVVSNRYHSDVIDAVLYAWKETPAYAYRKEPEKPKPSTKEWQDAEQARLEELAEAHFLAELQAQRDGLG